ncbi:MAG: thiamine-phosphate kinase, partial [Burkholderiales bacterium]|nr:thiamine-phosphate kinase [Burkholderiales bacterium]
YELCFTAARSRRRDVERAGERARVKVTRIGRVLAAPSGACAVAVVDRDGMPVRHGRAGFDHFR